MSLSVCSHCGAVRDARHDTHGCPVKDATRRILAGYRPRGATAGFDCPNGHGDGVWHWWPRTGAQGFTCEECGVVVDHRTGERLDVAEQARRLAEREARHA